MKMKERKELAKTVGSEYFVEGRFGAKMTELELDRINVEVEI